MKRYCLPLLVALLALSLLGGCGTSDESAQTGADGEAGASAGAEALADAVALVTDIPTVQYFTDEAIAEEDVETILNAGVNAPSAMNGQPWHFTAVTDQTVLQQISDDMSSGMSFGGTPPSGEGAAEGGELAEGAAESAQPPEGVEDAQLPEGAAEGEQAPEGVEEEAGASADAEGSEGGEGAVAVSKAGIADAPLAIVISCAEGSELDAGLACQNMSVAAQLLGYGTKIISSPTIALNGEQQAEYRELLGIPEDQSVVAVLLVGYEDTSVDESVDGYTGATERNALTDVVTYL
ncbi:MAG: nitroreductase family protein [Bacillota bacterium]|nr:nitroreductase family protein [Bacillota bacterium]